MFITGCVLIFFSTIESHFAMFITVCLLIFLARQYTVQCILNLSYQKL